MFCAINGGVVLVLATKVSYRGRSATIGPSSRMVIVIEIVRVRDEPLDEPTVARSYSGCKKEKRHARIGEEEEE